MKRKLQKKAKRQSKRQKLAQERDLLEEATEQQDAENQRAQFVNAVKAAVSVEEVEKIKKDFITQTTSTPIIQSAFTLLPVSTAETIKLLKTDQEEAEKERESRPVVGVWIGEVGDLTQVPDPAEIILPAEHIMVDKKQHRGLRCPKCFALLARDQDFDYKNGELWVDPSILRTGWEGMKIKGSTVFCQNMHSVGINRPFKFLNEARFIPILKISKTTFKENFLDNPDFKDSPLIENKLIHPGETHNFLAK